MLYHFDRIERDFGAKDAAELTGVSQVMQRDWRRHGYLPPAEPGKRVRFSLRQICMLALMKAQVDGGKAISGAHTVAELSVSVALTQIELCPLAVKVVGVEVSDAAKRALLRRIIGLEENEPTTRYMFFPNYASVPNFALFPNDKNNQTTCYHFLSLQEMEEKVARNWIVGQIFDLEGFAMGIAIKAGAPLITYKLRSISEGGEQ